MARIDRFRVGVILGALAAGGFALAVRGHLHIDATIAQTLVGAFSVLAGFLVSALAFIRPVETGTSRGLAVSQELSKKAIRISVFFYLYLLNIALLLTYLIARTEDGGSLDVLGKVALAGSIFSLVVSVELPRMIVKLRTFQS